MNYGAPADSWYLSEVGGSGQATRADVCELYIPLQSGSPEGTVQDKCVGNLQVCLNTHYSFLCELSEDVLPSFIISAAERRSHIEMQEEK